MIRWCRLFYYFHRTFLVLLFLLSLSSFSQWKLIGVNAQKPKTVLTIHIHHTRTYNDDRSNSNSSKTSSKYDDSMNQYSDDDIIPQSIIPNVMIQFESIILPRNDKSIQISARNNFKKKDQHKYHQKGGNETKELYDLFDVSYIKLVLHEYAQNTSSSVSSSSSSSSSKAIGIKTDDHHDGIFHEIMKARRKSNKTRSKNHWLLRRRYHTTTTTTTATKTNTNTILFYKSTASYRSIKTSIIDTDGTTSTNNETVWHGSTILTSTPALNHSNDDGIIGFCSLYLSGGIIRSGTFITDDTTYDLIYMMNNQSYVIRSTPWADYPMDDNTNDDYLNQTYSFDNDNNNDAIDESSRIQYPSLVSINPNENEIVTDWINVQGPAAIMYNNPSDDPSKSKSSSSNVVIDVLVIVTNRALCEYAGYYINRPSSTTPSYPYCSVTVENYTPIQNKIYQVIAETNNAMRYVNVEIRLLQIDFLIDDGSQNNITGWDPISTEEHIVSVRNKVSIQQTRRDQKADLVAVIAGAGGYCGIAVVLGYISITNHKCLSAYSFSHEIGHNFGCNHNREAYPITRLPDHPYAFAYNDMVNRKYRSIVAYECGGQGGNRCPRIPYYSSSVITLPDGSILGNETIDNLRTIGDYAPRLASYQTPNAPSRSPSRKPSSRPSSRPIRKPSSKPSRKPSSKPSRKPSSKPSRKPSSRPTKAPFAKPSRSPSKAPSAKPSRKPSSRPSKAPSSVPSYSPTISMSPTLSTQPSNQPSTSTKPSNRPSDEPSKIPSSSSLPSYDPSSLPSSLPTINNDPNICRTTCERRNWIGGNVNNAKGVMVYSQILFGSICIRRCIPPGFLFFYQWILRYSCLDCS